MPIAYLLPTGQTDTDSNIATGAFTDVDEGVDAGTPDGNYAVSIDKAWAGGQIVTYTMEDLPGGATTVNSVILRARGFITGTWVDDTIDYEWRTTGIGMTGVVNWNFEADDALGVEDRQATLTGGPPTVAVVNATIVQIKQIYGGTKSKEAITYSWDGFELEVDYNVAAAGVARQVISAYQRLNG
jgi:hypothetical protein